MFVETPLNSYRTTEPTLCLGLGLAVQNNSVQTEPNSWLAANLDWYLTKHKQGPSHDDDEAKALVARRGDISYIHSLGS
jgi:hypothetical protein